MLEGDNSVNESPVNFMMNGVNEGTQNGNTTSFGSRTGVLAPGRYSFDGSTAIFSRGGGFSATGVTDISIRLTPTGDNPETIAELNTMEAINIVSALPPSNVRTKGNQTALGQHMSQVIVALREGDIEEARNKLIQAIERTDGCALRGVPDEGEGLGPKPKKDYITDCPSQDLVYALLTDALEVLAP